MEPAQRLLCWWLQIIPLSTMSYLLLAQQHFDWLLLFYCCNVWCDFWAAFLISYSNRLVVFVPEFNFSCPKSPVLGMLHITKQDSQNKLHLLYLQSGSFCYVWLGFMQNFFGLSDTATTLHFQGLPANPGILSFSLRLAFPPPPCTCWRCWWCPWVFHTCCTKDTLCLWMCNILPPACLNTCSWEALALSLWTYHSCTRTFAWKPSLWSVYWCTSPEGDWRGVYLALLYLAFGDSAGNLVVWFPIDLKAKLMRGWRF